MQLNQPFIIGARLLPALQIGDGFLSYDKGKFILDGPFGEHVIAGFRPGAGAGLESQFSAVLSFLSAASDSYGRRLGLWENVTADDNATLFPQAVVEWAYQRVDDIDCLSLDISESSTPLITS